jgi:tripartite-type tricarboxylate transporter receptor subunit TctC
MPAKDLKEFIAWLKANPGKASFGMAGVAGIEQVAAVLFQKETGTRFGFVPYRGGAPALQDLMAGQIDMQMADPTTSLPAVRAGLVKAYAVMAKDCFPRSIRLFRTDQRGWL